MTETFHWAFDDTQTAVEHPGWKFECRAAECQKGICPKCHQALEDGRAYCPMCVAEHADPLASSIAQRQRAEKAEAKLAAVREKATAAGLHGILALIDPPPPLCPRCHGRGKIPDWTQGLNAEFGEPAAKPCPECQTEKSTL